MRLNLLHRSPRTVLATAVAMFAQALLLLLTFNPASADAEPGRLRVLILTGESDYPYHDWHSTTPFLRDLLEHTGARRLYDAAPGIPEACAQRHPVERPEDSMISGCLLKLPT